MARRCGPYLLFISFSPYSRSGSCSATSRRRRTCPRCRTWPPSRALPSALVGVGVADGDVARAAGVDDVGQGLARRPSRRRAARRTRCSPCRCQGCRRRGRSFVSSFFEGRDVAAGEVHNVDVVAHAGTIVGRDSRRRKRAAWPACRRPPGRYRARGCSGYRSGSSPIRPLSCAPMGLK